MKTWRCQWFSIQDAYLQQIIKCCNHIHACVGVMIPVLMAMMLTRFFGKNKKLD
ncbi:hypothetical protein O9992_22300 [Vibrio lentus]|nr:hypothetical protein [Vibrio lentus]